MRKGLKLTITVDVKPDFHVSFFGNQKNDRNGFLQEQEFHVRYSSIIYPQLAFKFYILEWRNHNLRARGRVVKASDS